VRSDAFPTTIAVVMIAARDGERRFLTAHRAPFERRVPRFDLAPIRPGRVLLIDGHFPAQALRAARRARELRVPVVADFSDPPLIVYCRVVDHAVPEACAAASIRGARVPAPESAIARITQSARWIYWHEAGASLQFMRPRATRPVPRRVHGAFAAGPPGSRCPRSSSAARGAIAHRVGTTRHARRVEANEAAEGDPPYAVSVTS
jgi:sugar/nucleoside kinase (ribokinase family)